MVNQYGDTVPREGSFFRIEYIDYIDEIPNGYHILLNNHNWSNIMNEMAPDSDQ